MNQSAVLRELKANIGLPWEKLAQRLGLTKRRVLDLVGLLDLPEEIKEDIRQKKLTERHGRALRQLLDKAEVLREAFNFLKEKKLTGDQSLEFVRKIKSEPRFTIADSFNELKILISKKVKPKKEGVETAILEAERLIKSLENIKIVEITKEKKSYLKGILFKVKRKIESILISVQD